MSVLCNMLPYVFMCPIICNGMTGNHKTVVVGFFPPKLFNTVWRMDSRWLYSFVPLHKLIFVSVKR